MRPVRLMHLPGCAAPIDRDELDHVSPQTYGLSNMSKRLGPTDDRWSHDDGIGGQSLARVRRRL